MWFLTVLDILLSTLVVGPCVVGFWRGTWQFMEAYRDHFPVWWTLWVSCALHFVFTLLRHALADYFRRGGLRYILISRCYIYVFAVCCAMQWRASWMILDEVVGTETHNVLLFFVPSSVILLATRLFCNTMAPPYCISIDSHAEEVFVFPTTFKISIRSLLSVILLRHNKVFNNYFSPSDYEQSDLTHLLPYQTTSRRLGLRPLLPPITMPRMLKCLK